MLVGVLEMLMGVGLSASAGLNAYIPLMMLGVLGRYTEWIALPDGWQWLQNGWVLVILGVLLVIVLSTMLHGIGVGNMLPAWVPVVCVDINPAVVTKLADRGSSQTIGLVTDVGLFLHQLAKRLP